MIDSIEGDIEILQEKLNACEGIAEAAAFIREHAAKAGFQIDVVTIKHLERTALVEAEEIKDTMAVLEEKRQACWEAERKEMNRSYERSL